MWTTCWSTRTETGLSSMADDIAALIAKGKRPEASAAIAAARRGHTISGAEARAFGQQLDAEVPARTAAKRKGRK